MDRHISCESGQIDYIWEATIWQLLSSGEPMFSILSRRSILGLAVVLVVCPLCRNSADEPTSSLEDTAIHVPTPPDVVDKMLELTKLTEHDVLYDLGCGDGRIVIAAAKKSGCQAVGYEIDERKVRQSQENVKQHQLEHLVRIEQQDIFNLDLRQASVITLFLLPEMNEQLLPQLEQMKAGSRIVCHEFPIAGIQHDQKLTLKSTTDGVPRDIYLYTLPLKKAK
jgi:SAM-dependent methyltransferase